MLQNSGIVSHPFLDHPVGQPVVQVLHPGGAFRGAPLHPSLAFGLLSKFQNPNRGFLFERCSSFAGEARKRCSNATSLWRILAVGRGWATFLKKRSGADLRGSGTCDRALRDGLSGSANSYA